MSALPQTPNKQQTGNYNFHLDLAQAQKTEEEISHLLTRYGFNTLNFNNDNQYDLLLEKNGKQLKLEIKEDFQGRTGNIAIEYMSRGKLSGVLSSKSDLWLYKIHTDNEIIICLMTLNKLKELIKQKKYSRTVKGGDRVRGVPTSDLYLFKIGVIKEISVVI